MFRAVSTKAKKSGLGFTKSTPIESEDLVLYLQYFYHDVMNAPEPKKLQKCVLFNIIYYFCSRGRQNIYNFQKGHFQVGYDPDGTKYVYQAVDELDKNHGIDVNLPAKYGRMYEQPGTYLSSGRKKTLSIKHNLNHQI